MSFHPAAAEIAKLLRQSAIDAERLAAANAAASQDDFLKPDWHGLRTYTVMRVQEAVALSCGINRRYAKAIHLATAATGKPLNAISEVRARMNFVRTKGFEPGAEVSIEQVADWAQRHHWELPAEFPVVSAALPSVVAPEAQPDGRGPRLPMKRQALVNKHGPSGSQAWLTIERDLQDASSNGLAQSKVGARGWDEEAALEWARSRGKYSDSASTTLTSALWRQK